MLRNVDLILTNIDLAIFSVCVHWNHACVTTARTPKST